MESGDGVGEEAKVCAHPSVSLREVAGVGEATKVGVKEEARRLAGRKNEDASEEGLAGGGE